MLLPEQIEEFDRQGVINCPGLIPEANLLPARELIFTTLLKTKHCDEHAHWIAGALDETEAAAVRKRASERCKKSKPYVELITTQVTEIVAELSAPTTQPRRGVSR